MVTLASPAEAERIAAAIGAAEAGTRAEIVCVLAHASSTYEAFPLAWASIAALALPTVLLPATLWSAGTIYFAQLTLFLAAFCVLSLPGLRLRLVPRALQRRQAHRAAAEQFLIRGLARKAERTGVLLFVSEAERYARVIADAGVATKVDQARWDATIAALVSGAREGRLADGYCAAIASCGAILAEHFPPDGRPGHELDDRLIVI